MLERSSEKDGFIRTGGLLHHCPHNRHTHSYDGASPHFNYALPYPLQLEIVPQRLKGHHKFKWEAVDPFGDSGPLPLPQQPPHKQMGLSPQDLDEISVSCNTWDESGAGTTMAGTAGYARNAALRNHFRRALMAFPEWI